MAKPIQFIKEVRTELGKVIWPSREQTIKMTLAVIIMALFVAIALGAIDYGLTELLQKFILK